MENRFTQAVLMTALLLTVIAGCERAPTGMAGQEEAAAASLLEEVPESGSTPMPAMQQLNSSVPSGLSSRAPTPTLAMLSRVKEGMAENEFPGQIGIRQSRSGDNPVYHYHQNTLRFPPGIVRLAEGGSTWFKYTYFSSSGEVLIQFQAVVPKTIQAAKMLKKWLRKMTDPEAKKTRSAHRDWPGRFAVKPMIVTSSIPESSVKQEILSRGLNCVRHRFVVGVLMMNLTTNGLPHRRMIRTGPTRTIAMTRQRLIAMMEPEAAVAAVAAAMTAIPERSTSRRGVRRLMFHQGLTQTISIN